MDSQGLVRGVQAPAQVQQRALAQPVNQATLTIPSNPVQRTASLLQRNAWTIIACVVIVTSLCLLRAARQPRLYSATAEIAIYRDNQASASLGKDYTQEVTDIDDYTVSLETQLHILQSRSLASGVVRKLGLDQNSDFTGKAQPSTEAPAPTLGNNADTTEAQSSAVDALLAGLSIQSVKDTRVVDVIFTGPHADLDARIVNALVDGFIEDSIRSRYESATRAAKFLSGQLADLRTKVEDSQQKLVAYERAHNIVGVDEKQNVVTTKLDDLNKQLTAAQADRIDKESLYQTIVAGSLDQIPESKTGDALQSLRLREAELKNEYAQANTVYGPNHPKVLELTSRLKANDASIQAELRRLEGRAREEYQVSASREHKLREAFEAQKVEANHLSESAIQYGLLKREVDSNRQLYDNLQERMKEAGVAAGLRSSNIRLIDAAGTPSSPVSPNLPRSGVVGLFLGFLASAAVVGVREGLNRSLRDASEVESFTAMPSLAIIPLWERPRTALSAGDSDALEIVTIAQPQSAVAEAFRALGTSIMLASPGLKTVLVTSPLPNEGKTVTAVNSALVVAQQGKRVLLIDADLRKPGLYRGLNLPNDVGLSSVLLGQAESAQVIRAHKALPSLSILVAGPAYSMGAELLGSSKMRELMSRWREEYDYIVVDTPPVLAVTDAIRLSALADSTLLIMRSGQTTREALSRSCDLINQAQVPVLGIVVNGVNPRSRGSYYYGYYPELAKAYYRNETSRS